MADLLININVKGGDKAVNTFGSISDAAEKASSSVNSFQEELKQTKGSTNQTIQEAVRLSKNFKDLAVSEKIVQKGIEQLNKGLITAEQFTLRYGKAVNNLKSEIKNSYGENLKYEKSLNEVSDALKKVTAQEQKAQASQERFAGVLKTVKAAAIGYATVLATMKLTDFVKTTITAGVELDSLQRSFKAITGNAQEAAYQMQFLRGTADELDLTYNSLEKSYKDILAASKGTALEGKGVEQVFTAISKASAVLGMTTDETQGALRALSQMISKGNVQAEELIISITYKILSLFNWLPIQRCIV